VVPNAPPLAVPANNKRERQRMDKYQIDAKKYMLYLRTIQPASTKFVFQTFTDSKEVTKQLKADKKRDPLACTFTATAEEALPRLQVLQNKGAGIFVQMNVSTARGKDNVTQLSTYFLDTDGAPIGPIIKAMPKPLMVVSSSKGNFHIYWRTTDALQSFKMTQLSLALSFGCDDQMVNLDRVVRIPGSWHLKDVNNPYPVGINLGEDKLYSAKDLLKCAPAPIPKQKKNRNGKAVSMEEAMVTCGDGFEMPDELPEGNRTHYLVSLAGKLVNEGFGADEVKKRIKETMLDLLPAGQNPIADETLEIEVYPAIENFIQRDARDVESGPVHAVTEQRNKASSPIDGTLPMPDDVMPMPTAGWAGDDGVHNPDELSTLEDFLAKFYHVEIGSRIISLRGDKIGNDYKLEEFKTTYGNKKRGKTVLTKSWLECDERKTVRDVMYLPNAPLIYQNGEDTMINSYKGPGLKVIETPHVAQIQIFLDHINYMFPNQEEAHVFLSWMAFTISSPEKRIPWSPFIISVPGVGKGWLAELLKHLVGRHNFSTIGPKNIKDGFNEFMFEKTVCVIDELKTNGKEQYDIVEALKSMITEPDISINIKFGAKGTYPTYVNILCFSNHTNALPVEEGDRRFWVHRVTAEAKAPDYYVELFKWLNTDGPAHLYQWLKNYDVGTLCITAAPTMTAAKREMINSFKTEIEVILSDAIEDRTGPFVAAVIPREIMEIFVANALGADKLSSSEKHQIKMFRMNKCMEREGPEKRIRVLYGNDKGKKYPVIVRNFSQWTGADPKALSDEMERAWRTSLGQQPGANLEAVENGDD
tara:strand:+ start:25469 stop:27910 length:2442 start_codon:yes stop_codon:yes gene_type:complete